jgi:hypothetical protein
MTIYYLYVKTHNITGLKYLGYTKREDPYKYKGSGKKWLSHINKHNYDVTTEILKECSFKNEVKEWGLYYSHLWNIVEERDEHGNKTWANLKPEEGGGGTTISGQHHHACTDEWKNHMRHTVWTGEKRKAQGKKSREITLTRSPEMKEQVNIKLSAAWTEERKKDNSLRMSGDNNPSKNPEVLRKIADSKNKWTPEYKKSLKEKVSGENHYRNSPSYVSSQVGEGHPNYNPTIFTFYNTITGEIVEMTRYEFIKTFNHHQGNVSSLIAGRKKSVKGWILKKN